MECAMSIPVLDADIESELADVRDVPLSEISGGSCQIPARDDISAFNSSI
jgi:hypothetical protein